MNCYLINPDAEHRGILLIKGAVPLYNPCRGKFICERKSKGVTVNLKLFYQQLSLAPIAWKI